MANIQARTRAQPGHTNRTPLKRVRAGAGLVIALLLAGCGGSAPPPRAEQPPPRVPQYLPMSEELAAGLVMAPIGWDARGCVQYLMETRSQPQLRSIFYRTHSGDFSTIEEEAACT